MPVKVDGTIKMLICERYLLLSVLLWKGQFLIAINKKNSMASVCKRTIPTERTLLVSEVNANFLPIEGAT
jgi:hypothetical protein